MEAASTTYTPPSLDTEIPHDEKEILASARKLGNTVELFVELDNGPDLTRDLPDKASGKRRRGLRYRVYIVYRRLFSLVWLLNIAAFIVIIAIPSINRTWLGLLSSINLSIAVLVRQDFVINA